MHIMEPPDLWEKYIDPEFKSMAPRGLTSNNVRDLRVQFPGQPARAQSGQVNLAGHNFERNQGTYRDHSERGWTADCQLEAMDIEGIDLATLFPTRGLSVLLGVDDHRFGAAIARAYNNWLADFCAADPDRLFGAGMIAVREVNDAIEEAHRVVEKFHFRSVFLRSYFADMKPWHDPYYEPLWDTLEELNVPLRYHEASGRGFVGDGFDPNFGLRRVYTQPMGQMLGMGHFVGGGILARHPRLKVAFLEANCSWLPWLLWRMDEGYEREGDVCMPDLTMAPTEYFKRQCWVSVEPDETPARHVIEDYGADNIVFSTDYPHGDSKYPEAVEGFLELPLADEAKRKILWDNCARLYALTEAPVTAR